MTNWTSDGDTLRVAELAVQWLHCPICRAKPGQGCIGVHCHTRRWQPASVIWCDGYAEAEKEARDAAGPRS